MNDIFNLRRFSLLFKKTILERPWQLLGITALTLIATLIVFSFFVYHDHFGDAHALSFAWGFAGGGIILASVVFSHFNTNAGGAAYLTLPASTFEKWLCGVLISGVLFSCIFLAFFRLMDICAVSLYHANLNKNDADYHRLYAMAHIYLFNDENAQYIYFIFLNIGGAALLGSLYFNKANFIKTAGVIITLFVFVMSVNYMVAQLFFNNLSSANPFFNVMVKVGTDFRMVSAPPEAGKIFKTSIKYVAPAILWLTAYIRLREKEI